MIKPKRGTTRTIDLYNNSYRCHGSSCWHWMGAKSKDGTPRIYTLDYDRSEKRLMSCANAVWHISQNRGLGDLVAYRTCATRDCVNPEHVSVAKSHTEMIAAMAKMGRYKTDKGKAQRLRVIRQIRGMNGFEPMTDEIVMHVLESPLTGIELSKQLGFSTNAIYRIRRGETYRHITRKEA